MQAVFPFSWLMLPQSDTRLFAGMQLACIPRCEIGIHGPAELAFDRGSVSIEEYGTEPVTEDSLQIDYAGSGTPRGKLEPYRINPQIRPVNLRHLQTALPQLAL